MEAMFGTTVTPLFGATVTATVRPSPQHKSGGKHQNDDREECRKRAQNFFVCAACIPVQLIGHHRCVMVITVAGTYELP